MRETAGLSAVLRALDDPRRALAWATLRAREDALPIADLAALVGTDVRGLSRVVAPLIDAGLVSWHAGTVAAVPGRLGELVATVEADQPLTALVARQPRLATFIRHGVIDLVPGDTELREELLDAVEQALPEFDTVTEPELTAMLAPLARDVALVRRWLIDTGRLRRSADGSEYRPGWPPAARAT
jgi:hypothetical protein